MVAVLTVATERGREKEGEERESVRERRVDDLQEGLAEIEEQCRPSRHS